ncbi:MAG TPA: type II secretion system protein GspM [Bryobacteraceae bacterium]|nr:type II secretion system protein GspM [Bryobacteraceae bacterium]
MNISERDQRALQFLGAALLLAAVVYFWPESSTAATAAAGPNTTELLEKRLTKARQLLLQVPDKQALYKQVQSDLSLREKGMLPGDTAAQAQAQLFQILRRVGRAQGPPIEMRANEIGQARTFGEDYGEVAVSVSFECGIEQLVNLLADLGAQPELLATNEIRIGQAQGAQKVIPVRLSVSGIVPRKLVPDKKGLSY